MKKQYLLIIFLKYKMKFLNTFYKAFFTNLIIIENNLLTNLNYVYNVYNLTSHILNMILNLHTAANW